jgi:tRNA G46 methylase TrmB
MAFIQLESDNPVFSFLIHKNPASGMIVRQLRHGLLFGYYSQNNPNQFNCWFKDHDSMISYDPNKEFEFNDITRYSAATLINNCFDEFFHELIVKDSEDDSSGLFNNSLLLNCIRVKKQLLDLFTKSFRDFKIHYEPMSRSFFRVQIGTKQSLRKLLCFTGVIALVSAIQNREIKFIDDNLLVKYAKFIQYLDSPYFVRYMFKVNLIRREEKFNLLRPILETESIKLTMGRNFLQRLQFIKNNIVENAVIIDVGCGEGQYLQLAKNAEKYYAIDKDENCLEKCQNRIEKLELNNVELLNSLDELPNINARKNILLTEVIEHNTKNEAQNLIRKCLSPNTKIIITTPNRDFNIHYSFADEIENERENENNEKNNEDNNNIDNLTIDDNTIEENNSNELTHLRHSGHVFEFCDSEFRQFITQTLDGINADIQFFNLGDQVDKITPQSAAIIEL